MASKGGKLQKSRRSFTTRVEVKVILDGWGAYSTLLNTHEAYWHIDIKIENRVMTVYESEGYEGAFNRYELYQALFGIK